ncbi:hypothetical protein MHF_0202 [Mycoplasma haemofelis Ohio2]|uniref:Uncharacterized protein n=1 Tax=Mycoplasma haemofelis (strain Ohio2) TaxID=859194 RepID=F6FGB1_MYCHI|nr:hypothetical protein MHF_0202 [Mycoplasma haemofelis Ohio2]
MALKLVLSVLGGIGVTSSALVAGILGSRSSKESSEKASDKSVEPNSKPIKDFKKLSDLVSSADFSQKCLIFYVEELGEPEDNGISGYDGHKNTFNSTQEALQSLQSDGLKDSDLSTVLCGDSYGSRRYTLSKEGDQWQTTQIQ